MLNPVLESQPSDKLVELGKESFVICTLVGSVGVRVLLGVSAQTRSCGSTSLGARFGVALAETSSCEPLQTCSHLDQTRPRRNSRDNIPDEHEARYCPLRLQQSQPCRNRQPLYCFLRRSLSGLKLDQADPVLARKMPFGHHQSPRDLDVRPRLCMA